MAGEETGKLTKLRIKPFKDPEFTEEDGDEDFTVMYNPQEYAIKYQVESDDSQGAGTSGSASTFKKIKPQNLSLDFTIDGTGVTTGETKDIPKRVQKFLDIAYEFKGDKHRPRYLMILWGTLIFKCTLDSCSVKYTLFNSDGTPIRAKISATFKGFIDDKKRAAKEDKSSPDLTHRRTINDGDTLPLMCHRIYGDSKYYLEVARVNNLKNFSKLETGTTLYFPPLGD